MTAADWKELVMGVMLALIAYRQHINDRRVKETRGNTVAIHTLVNGHSTAMLGELATFARRVADLTGKEEDLRTAEMKEQAYLDKQAAQQRIER